MSHDHDPDIKLPFGMAKKEDKTIGELPDWYLKWLLDENWFHQNYPQFVDHVDGELNWRKDHNQHID